MANIPSLGLGFSLPHNSLQAAYPALKRRGLRGGALGSIYDWTSENPDRSVYQILATIPLRLYEQASDYNRAFRRVNFAPPNDAYIYYGKATVGAFGNGLVLVADKEMAKRDSKETVPFHVHVVCDIENPENRMEAQTIERLSEAMLEHRPVYWYAYGAPALNNEGTLFELVVREPSHIYIFPRPRKPRR